MISPNAMGHGELTLSGVHLERVFPNYTYWAAMRDDGPRYSKIRDCIMELSGGDQSLQITLRIDQDVGSK